MLSAARLWKIDFTISVRQTNPDFRWRRHVWWVIAGGIFLATGTAVVLAALLLVFGRSLAERIGISTELLDPIALVLGTLAFVNILLSVSGRESRELTLPFDLEALDAAGYRKSDVLVARLWLPKLASCMGWMGLIAISHLSFVPNSLSTPHLQTLVAGLFIAIAGHALGAAIPLVQQRRFFNGKNIFLILLCIVAGLSGWTTSTLAQWLKGDIEDWETAISNALVSATAPRVVLAVGTVAALILLVTCAWLLVRGRRLAAGALVSYCHAEHSRRLTFPLTRFVKSRAEQSALAMIFLRPFIAAFRATSGDDSETLRIIRWSIAGIAFGMGLHLGGTSALFEIVNSTMAPTTLLLGVASVPLMHAQVSLQAHREMRSFMFDHLSSPKINFALAGGALLASVPSALALYTILTWLYPHAGTITALFFAAWLLSPLPGLVSDLYLKRSSNQSAFRINQTVAQTLISGQIAVILLVIMTFFLNLTNSPAFVFLAAFAAVVFILLLLKPRMRALA